MAPRAYFKDGDGYTDIPINGNVSSVVEFIAKTQGGIEQLEWLSLDTREGNEKIRTKDGQSGLVGIKPDHLGKVNGGDTFVRCNPDSALRVRAKQQ